jgi:uncharacterized protein YjbI with pentapeptide repeats
MSTRIEKAAIADAEVLTEIMRRTFDEEARKWLPDDAKVIDYNIQPPGYDSVGMNRFMIRELNYYKVLFNGDIVGGIIVTVSGKSYGRIDRIFVDPEFQGKGIGSKAMELIEQAFPYVRSWDLETSSRQTSNHAFYEKMGYQTTFETQEEFYYMKRTGLADGMGLVQNKDLSHVQYENCKMEMSEFYQVNLEGSSFSNSNLSKVSITNANLSRSRFLNINFRDNLFADLNLSNSELAFVSLSGVRFTDTNLGKENEPISFDRCDLEGSKIKDCNLKNVQIETSDLAGMKINNIPVEELLELYERVHKN